LYSAEKNADKTENSVSTELLDFFDGELAAFFEATGEIYRLPAD